MRSFSYLCFGSSSTYQYRYTAAHTLDLYSEVAAICRPPLSLTASELGSFKKSQTPATGYIISVFKVFEGDDGERFEKNWLYWTGARMLYRWRENKNSQHIVCSMIDICIFYLIDICQKPWACDALHCIKAYRQKAIKCICSCVNALIC